MAKDLLPLKMTDDLKLVVKACLFCFVLFFYISLLPLKMTDDLKLVAKACFFFFNDISPYSRTFQV